MLVTIVQAAMPVREIDDRISDLFLWSFKFHFDSVFKIIKLEIEL